MAVYVDGGVSFCNLDHENETNLGSLLEQSVDEIWAGPRMRRIRREMTAQKVSERVCQRCLGSLVPEVGQRATETPGTSQKTGEALWQTFSS